MADRKQFQSGLVLQPEVQELIQCSRKNSITEAELKEQRISFAFGNAPPSDFITKESVRITSKNIRLNRSSGG